MSRKALKITAAALFLAALSGCQSSPFAQDLPQTPYQRYDQLRGQDRYADGSQQHGSTTPQELRRRLAPLDQQ